jgi:hypothetical protein
MEQDSDQLALPACAAEVIFQVAAFEVFTEYLKI